MMNYELPAMVAVFLSEAKDLPGCRDYSLGVLNIFPQMGADKGHADERRFASTIAPVRGTRNGTIVVRETRTTAAVAGFLIYVRG